MLQYAIGIDGLTNVNAADTVTQHDVERPIL